MTVLIGTGTQSQNLSRKEQERLASKARGESLKKALLEDLGKLNEGDAYDEAENASI